MTFPVDVLVAPFTLVLARPRARGRRAVASCLAACLEGNPGPRGVWLEADGAARLQTPSGLLEDLRRRCAARGLVLPGAATALPKNTGCVLHCDDDGGARDLRQALSRPDALPPGWRLAKGPGDADGENPVSARAAFAAAVAPGAAPLCAWVVESCKAHADVLEPFCRAARALFALRSDAASIARTETESSSLAGSAAAALGEGLAAAAPALARHAARCAEGAARERAGQLAWRDQTAALELVEALCLDAAARDAAAALRRPLESACGRAKHHAVRAVRATEREAPGVFKRTPPA